MQVKAGVKLPPMVHALVVFDDLFQKFAGAEVVITSMLDGKHKPGSKHYSGDAFDCRTRHLRPDQIAVIAAEGQERLGKAYDVVIEATHIHVEYDPK